MENILLTLVVVLLVMLLIMMVGLFYVGWKILKNKNSATVIENKTTTDQNSSLPNIDRLHPEIIKRMEDAKALKDKIRFEATCHNHPKEPSEGACAICDKYFCKSCLKSHQNLLFCREHISLYLNSHWEEVYSVKSTPNNPEAGVIIVDWKKEIWDTESLPLFVQTHYKINVDGDQIESWVVLFSRVDEKDDIKKRLTALKPPAALDH